MKILDILGAPWAILPAKHDELCEVYSRHLRGEKADLAAIEARLGKPLDNKPPRYQIQDGVAILPIDGVISKRMSMFADISGGASTDQLGALFAAALNDPSAHSIVLAIDSPGGTVTGVQDLAHQIFAARGSKPIVAFTDGYMASAAYWIGAAADKIFISNDTTQVGSIGVVARHVDKSKALESSGLKVTEVSAGKYKRIASDTAPLSDAGRQSIQDDVDYMYSTFINDIAAFRGVETDDALAMADGKVFIGRQAIKVGLVDGEMTLPAVIAMLNDERQRDGVNAPKKGAVNMKTEHEHAAEIAAAKEAGKAEGIAAGAAAERDRIAGIDALSMAGHEELITSLKADVNCSVAQAAIKVLAAEKAAKKKVNADLKNDAPTPVAISTDATRPKKEDLHEDKDQGAAAAAAKASADPLSDAALKAEWEAGAATVQKEFLAYEDFVSFKRQAAKGNAKIYGDK